MMYEETWKEHKLWIENSIELLKRQQINSTGKERERIVAKLEGLNLAYQHMSQSGVQIEN